MNSTTQRKGECQNRKWFLVDLNGQTLGRVSTQIAALLMGKNNSDFSFHRDDGAYVVAVNAASITVSGNKANEKVYYHHTGYPGGIKELTYKEMMIRDPKKVIIHSVYGMLPKNKLRDRRISRLKVFLDSQHPYADKLK